MAKQISKPDKTSLVIDHGKVERAKRILGTQTIVETVDAALEDVINHDRRMALLERIRREGGIGPSPEELRRLREPQVPLYLADTSAWHRSAAVFDRWSELVARADVAMSPPVMLEILCSARSSRDARTLRDQLSSLPQLPLDQRAAAAALALQAELTERAQHRGPRPMDLLIAAIADVNDAILLHYDRHFDTVARVTGQPMEWLARRGSLD